MDMATSIAGAFGEAKRRVGIERLWTPKAKPMLNGDHASRGSGSCDLCPPGIFFSSSCRKLSGFNPSHTSIGAEM
jgi:hypothetical protein